MTTDKTDGNEMSSIGAFERNNYFYGKLLTVRDFQAEQLYFIDKERAAHRLLHGTGIVSGLTVKSPSIITENAQKTFVVKLGEGYALDCFGREIVVPLSQESQKVEGQLQVGTNYLYLEYFEQPKEATQTCDTAAGSNEGGPIYGRTIERFKLSVSSSPPVQQRMVGDKETLGKQLDECELSVGLRDAFKSQGMPLTDKARVRVQQQGSEWAIDDANADYLLRVRVENEKSNVYAVDVTMRSECTDAKVFLAVVDLAANGLAEPKPILNESETAAYRSVVYSNARLGNLLLGHLEDSCNPHQTTAKQVGALVSVNDLQNPGGSIDFISPEGSAIKITDDKTHTITISEDHSTRTNNPHDVTAKQIGALLSINDFGVIDLPDGKLELTSPDGSIKIDHKAGTHSIDFTLVRPIGDWPTVERISWKNDQSMASGDFNGGLLVTFSEPMHPATVTLDTFIVTIEVRDSTAKWPGRRSLILDGELAVEDWAGAEQGEANRDKSQTWRFTPRPKVTAAHLAAWIGGDNGSTSVHANSKRLRCRVVLKGNAILAADGERPLDGDVFVQVIVNSGTSYSGLVLPSGDGNRGGDFESWFYLEAKSSAEEPDQEDDLTVIDGIGPTFAERLKEANVRTFADLAELTPGKLADILGSSTKRVEDSRLIDQARQLAQAG